MTAEELVFELVQCLSVNEKLRLLAWANAPRLDEVVKEIKVKRSSGFGPGSKDEPKKILNAVAGR